jgi:hypothetical protein
LSQGRFEALFQYHSVAGHVSGTCVDEQIESPEDHSGAVQKPGAREPARPRPMIGKGFRDMQRAFDAIA